MKALGKGSIASIVRIGLVLAWWILWLGAAIVGGFGILLALISIGIMDPEVLSTQERMIRIGGERVENLPDTWPVLVPAVLIAAVAIGGSLIIVWRLRKLFDSFTSGEPFRRENATHLRIIWITMLAIELARYALLAATAGVVAHYGQAENVALRELRISAEPSTWGSILILIVLAEVFREGARLKEEQELTI